MKKTAFFTRRLADGCARLALISRWILFVGLPYIAAHLLFVAVRLAEDLPVGRLYVCKIYAPQVEALLCSLTILIGGALLFDYLDKKR